MQGGKGRCAASRLRQTPILAEREPPPKSRLPFAPDFDSGGDDPAFLSHLHLCVSRGPDVKSGDIRFLPCSRSAISVTTSTAKPVRSWRLNFPVEVFRCGLRQDGRRLFLPLMCALSLLLTILVLWGAWEAPAFRRTGIRFLPFVAGTVFFGIFVFVGLNIPFALRTATSDDDLPLVMLTGLSPLALWRARVTSAALPAVAIPLVHLPLLMFLFTLGGIQLRDYGSVALFWLAGWLLACGWSSLAGCIWMGSARDRMQGLALTFIIGFLHILGVALIVRCLAWISSPWTWWVAASFQPAWNWTGPEFLRLWIHVVFGGFAAWIGVIVLRGRWRSAVEAGSRELSPKELTPIPVESSSTVPAPHFDDEPSRKAAPQRPRCGVNPWFWKDFHVSGGSWFYWMARLVVAIGLQITVLFFLADAVRGRYIEPVIVLTMFGWFIWMMFEVAQVLAIEFQDRMWSIVRITPNSVSTIFWSKMTACGWKMVPSLLPLGLVLLLGLATDAWEVAAIGTPVLLLLSFPIAALILYGSAIPQTLLGAGWPMVRTLGALAVAMACYIGWLIVLGSRFLQLRMETALFLGWTASIIMSVGSTIWLIYATLCELDNPRRERQSSDGA